MNEFEEIVRERLGDDRVRSVWLKASLNSDGEPVLRIYVVYEGGKQAPSVEEMQSITDQLWDQTLRDGRPDLVVPSFISSDDARDLRSA